MESFIHVLYELLRAKLGFLAESSPNFKVRIGFVNSTILSYCAHSNLKPIVGEVYIGVSSENKLVLKSIEEGFNLTTNVTAPVIKNNFDLIFTFPCPESKDLVRLLQHISFDICRPSDVSVSFGDQMYVEISRGTSHGCYLKTFIPTEKRPEYIFAFDRTGYYRFIHKDDGTDVRSGDSFYKTWAILDAVCRLIETISAWENYPLTTV